jgi:molecular chaperone GrpE
MSDKNHKTKDEMIADETASEQIQEVADEEIIIDDSANKIAELEALVAQHKDEYLRAHADFENIKKRYEKEKYQAIDYANEQFARDLLSVADALEAAFKSGENASDEVAKKIEEGVGLTLEQLKKVFEKHGIKEIEVGEFDPNFHNAVLQEEGGDKSSGSIVQVFQKGYTIKGRVLRAAMVSIAK